MKEKKPVIFNSIPLNEYCVNHKVSLLWPLYLDQNNELVLYLEYYYELFVLNSCLRYYEFILKDH